MIFGTKEKAKSPLRTCRCSYGARCHGEGALHLVSLTKVSLLHSMLPFHFRSCRDLYPQLLLPLYFVSPLVVERGGEQSQRNRKCCSCKTVTQSPCFRKLRPRFFSFSSSSPPPPPYNSPARLQRRCIITE
jgi:hypothetical protein